MEIDDDVLTDEKSLNLSIPQIVIQSPLEVEEQIEATFAQNQPPCDIETKVKLKSILQARMLLKKTGDPRGLGTIAEENYDNKINDFNNNNVRNKNNKVLSKEGKRKRGRLHNVRCHTKVRKQENQNNGVGKTDNFRFLAVPSHENTSNFTNRHPNSTSGPVGVRNKNVSIICEVCQNITSSSSNEDLLQASYGMSNSFIESNIDISHLVSLIGCKRKFNIIKSCPACTLKNTKTTNKATIFDENLTAMKKMKI